MSWTIDRYKDFEDLAAALTRYHERASTWAYRGQVRDYETAHPLFSRHCMPTLAYSERTRIEQEMITRVQSSLNERIGCQLTGDPRTTTLVMLSLMQHYRGPTRLLDWTQNSFVAAYFTCAAHSPKDLDEDGVLYLFNLPALIHYADQSWGKYTRVVGGTDGAADFRDTLFANKPERWLCPLFLNDVGEQLKNNTIINQVNPFIRIRAQQSIFTIAGGNDMDHLALIDQVLPDQVAADDSPEKRWLAGPTKYKMIIAASLKRKLVRWLEEDLSVPVSAATLFPGLDGTGMRESLALMVHEVE